MLNIKNQNAYWYLN